MRKALIFTVIAVMAVSMLAAGGPPSWAGKGNGNGAGNGKGGGVAVLETIKQNILSMPKQSLSEDEIKAILWMREEEKLARDVYRTLYDIWKVPIFMNISKSEQTHMDAVKILIEKYGLEDPAKDDKIGSFTNEEIEKLYKQLVDMGKKSLVDALTVGMIIEDLDIYDLQKRLKVTDNEDVKFVFENLMKGSRNHMRSFYRLLKSNGGDYSPKYINKEEFERIISSPLERGAW